MFPFRRKKRPSVELDPARLSDDPAVLKEQRRLLEAAAMHTSVYKSYNQQRRSERTRVAFRWVLLFMVMASFGNMLFIYHTDVKPKEMSEPHVGIVDIRGPIATGSEASADRILTGVRRAMANEDAMAALVIRINSPGGSPAESQRIFHEIRRQRQLHPDTPIYSWIGDVGASGSYYIAAATQQIVASPSALVGSIGVISSGFGFTELLSDIGIERRIYAAGDNKSFLDPFSPVSEAQSSAWQSVLENTHAQFIRDVKAGRNGKLDVFDDDDNVFSGMVWSGQQALALGLVDDLTNLDDVYRSILPQEDGSRPVVINYTVGMSAIERLAKSFSASLTAAFDSEAAPGVRYEWSW